jgi:hypothetical protein
MDSSLPALASETDTATQAFARLAGKVDLLEAAIAGLAAKREAAPDYSETLGEIAALLDKMHDAMAEQIAAAGKKARAEDGAVIQQARERIDGRRITWSGWRARSPPPASNAAASYGRRAAACSRGCCYGRSFPA